jgi:transposase
MSPILPDPTHLRLDLMRFDADVITLVVASTAPVAPCPLCRQCSDRIHSRYVRTLADLPWSGVAVRLQLTIHRFVCETLDCPRRIFAERLPTIAAPYARRTVRLTDAFALVGFAIGGEAGARTLGRLAMTVSPDTLLRVIRATVLPEHETPRVLGVDDWAFQRGKRYGSILIDLERRCRVDLLPDRTAETLRQWLEEHPGVEVMSRDRGGAYADGARRGAPEAVQIADRFHLLRNLHDALERLVLRHRSALQQPQPAETSRAEPEPAPRDLPRKEQEKVERRAKRLERYEEVMALHRQGMSIQAICRTTGLARRTVRTFLRSNGFPERAPRAPRPGLLTPYESYLQERVAAGCENGQQLWRELRERGYPGSASPIYAWLTGHRTHSAATGRRRKARCSADHKRTDRLSPKQGAWLLQREPTDLDAEEQALLQRLCDGSEALAVAYQLAQELGRLVRDRDHTAFDPWIEAVQESGLSELQSFATGLCQDRPAVEAALTSEFSNGQVEGQVNRLKAIKRQMYGRANFDLLRQRVLYAA